MKPEPSEVTWRGVLALRAQEILEQVFQRRAGRQIAAWRCCGGAFRVWVVAILTTVGSSLAARSAKESGAGRAPARATGQQQEARTGQARHRNGTHRSQTSEQPEFGAQYSQPASGSKQGENLLGMDFRKARLARLPLDFGERGLYAPP